jgi:hypothetical protein
MPKMVTLMLYELLSIKNRPDIAIKMHMDPRGHING